MMPRQTLALASLGIALIAINLLACSRQPESEPAEASPEVQIAHGALKDVERVSFDDASVERGMRIVVGLHECASSSSCFSCYQCHGVRGEGSSIAIFPRLTGQSYDYLHRSLQDFASGRRPNPTMQEVVSGLTEQQMRDVAAYYSAVRPAISLAAQPPGEDGEAMIAAGRQIATQGSTEPAVQACAECHGDESREPAAPIYPYIAGQYAGYIESQLNAFSEGSREDPTQIMNYIADQLTGEQRHAVAQYYAALAPTPDPPEPSSVDSTRAQAEEQVAPE